MTCRLLFVVAPIAGLLACACRPALAQSRMERATAAASTQGETRSTEAANSPPVDKPAATAMPTDPGSAVLSDPSTRQRYLDAMQRYYEYRANGYAYRSRVFEWQLFSSRVIFLIVLVLVGAGIYFAAVQFRGAMRAAARPAAAVELSPSAPGMTFATQLEVSAKGIVVNSSVMGVIILALSLAFFYLYLVYVYPITDVI
jgi:hypothetical protein